LLAALLAAPALADDVCLAPRCLDVVVPVPAGLVVPDSTVRVLLPTDYDGHRRYPVLYLLHGAGDTFATWSENTDVVDFSAQFPVIIVMPDGGHDANAGWYSDWVDGSRQWETFHTSVLVRYVDRHFRTLGGGHRAVAGLSMGGFGAMSYAARHRGLYTAAVPDGKDFYLGGYHGWPYWERELHWALPQIVPLIDGAPRRGRGSAARGGLLRRLDVDRDRHLVADGDAARLEDLVPGEAEVLAVDRGGGLRAGAGVAPRVLDLGRGALDVEAHLARDAVEGEVADHLEVTWGARLDLLRHEHDRRVPDDVEEVGALQMRVALFDAGVDAGGVDGGLDLGAREVLLLHLNRPAQLAERAAHGAHHEVAHRELHARVRGVEIPGGGPGERREREGDDDQQSRHAGPGTRRAHLMQEH